MPHETLESVPAAATAELPVPAAEANEQHIDAAEFCQAFADICLIERQVASRYLKVPADKLAPHYIATHLKPEQSKVILHKLDMIYNSEKNHQIIEKVCENSDLPLLREKESRNYIVDLVRTGMMGGLIDEVIKNKNSYINGTDFRIYKSRLVEAHGAYINLIDSDFGRQTGFGRKHLRTMLRLAYATDGPESNKMAHWTENGIAAEIGTKRYIERVLQESVGQVRYSTINEDLSGRDLAVEINGNTLFIDVKSGDKNGFDDEDEKRAHYTRIEQIEPGVYKVRQLHPADNKDFGEDFEITSPEYKKVIESLLQEFSDIVAIAR